MDDGQLHVQANPMVYRTALEVSPDEQPQPCACRCAGAGESRVRPGGDPVEDHAEVPFEPLVALVLEAPGLLDE
jgi:hypothetical protein